MHVFLSHLAQTVGLLTFITAFAMVLVYTLAPRNRATFENASRLPLQHEDDPDEQ